MAVLSRAVSEQIVAERAHFTRLLLSSLEPSSQADAERQIREAEVANPLEFAATCAEELGDTAQPPLARQLAGLLLRRCLARSSPLVQRWSKEIHGPVRTLAHAALERAIQDNDRAVWSSGAAAAARIAAFEIPLGVWPGLVPQLQQWVEGPLLQEQHDSGSIHEAALFTIKCLAEEWYFGTFVTGEQWRMQRPSVVILMLAAAIRGMATCGSTRLRIAAAEALLAILKCDLDDDVADGVHSDPGEFLRAVLAGCCVDVPLELQLVSFRCLERICSDFYRSSSPFNETVFSVALCAIRLSGPSVQIAAMNICCVLACRLKSQSVGDDALRPRFAAELLPAILEALSRDVCDGSPTSLLHPARQCLSMVCELLGPTGDDVVLDCAGTHLESSHLSLRRSALVAFGSAAARSTDKMASIVSSSVTSLMHAVSVPELCHAACWAIGRALEFHATAIPESCKSALFPICLRAIRDPVLAEDFGYVMNALVATTAATAQQFMQASALLIQGVVHSESHGRSACFTALCILIKGAEEESVQHFGDFALHVLQVVETLRVEHRHTSGRRVCWDGTECTYEEFQQYYASAADRCWKMSPVAGRVQLINGSASCLHTLTDRLGSKVSHVAEAMMPHYVANLQVSCASGVGLDEDTLRAVASLATHLGPGFLAIAGKDSPLWPLLLHGMGECAATPTDLHSWEHTDSCAASLTTFCFISDALGPELVHCGCIERALDNVLRLLQVADLPADLTLLSVKVLGRLVHAVGSAVIRLSEILEALHKAAAAALDLTSRGKRSDGHVNILKSNGGAAWGAYDSPAYGMTVRKRTSGNDITAMALQSYVDVCHGLVRTGHVFDLKPHLPSVFGLLSKCLEHSRQVLSPSESNVRHVAMDLLLVLKTSFPEGQQNAGHDINPALDGLMQALSCNSDDKQATEAVNALGGLLQTCMLE